MPEGRWIKVSRHSARWPLALRWGKTESRASAIPAEQLPNLHPTGHPDLPNNLQIQAFLFGTVDALVTPKKAK
jgi:hypothetical protein